MVITRELMERERPALETHFFALGTEDRRLRFGRAFSDDGLREYVERIDFAHDAVFGVSDAELALVGAAHLARSEDFAELGISVLPAHRGHGIGAALLSRSATHARNWGIRTLFMHCLTENAAILHLARKQGMQIVATGSEAEAFVKLPPASPSSVAGELFAERVGLLDYAFKSQVRAARRLTVPSTGTPERGKLGEPGKNE